MTREYGPDGFPRADALMAYVHALTCALYPYVPQRPGMTFGPVGTPVRAVRA
jgi:hypothetical protein